MDCGHNTFRLRVARLQMTGTQEDRRRPGPGRFWLRYVRYRTEERTFGAQADAHDKRVFF